MTLIWIVFYLTIAILDVAMDGMFCYVAKRKFKLWPSIAVALVWPVSMPICICSAFILTRDFPEWDKD